MRGEESWRQKKRMSARAREREREGERERERENEEKRKTERSGGTHKGVFWRRGAGDLKMISTVGQSGGSSWRKESQK